jgi:hypothetical protein
MKGSPAKGWRKSVYPRGFVGIADPRVSPEPNTGCWLWMGDTWHGKPYGRVYDARDKKSHRVHRWFYENLVGPIPDGLVIDHLCNQPACVNSDHLKACTHAENVLRSTNPAAVNARATHCRTCGGEFSVVPRYDHRKTQRLCIPCHKANIKQRKNERKSLDA